MAYLKIKKFIAMLSKIEYIFKIISDINKILYLKGIKSIIYSNYIELIK